MIMETVIARPIAIVDGQPLLEVPIDLFIPPDALEVLLESFSGPLDLLLYLIKKQNFDILNIPVALITKQYMHYVQLMKEQRLELVADYLVMAAVLAEIKSRMLLPKPTHAEDEIEDDPRAMLVRKLQLYEQFKEAARLIEDLPRCDRDNFRFCLKNEGTEPLILPPNVALDELVEAMFDLLEEKSHQINHQISREPLSVRERMAVVLVRLQQEKSLELIQLFTAQEGRMGLAVSLLAILELARQSLIKVVQIAAFDPVHIQEVTHD